MSLQQASDVISKHLDDYEWALRKHGIKTVTGALSSVLTAKSLGAITTGVGVGALVGGPIWAALAGGLLIAAKCSVWVADRHLELEMIRREIFPEVALLYEAKKLPKKKG